MRKRFIAILIFIMVLSFTMTASASSSTIGFTINNKITEVPEDMGQAFLSNSRTFVPLRFVSETLGFEVGWDGKARTASIQHNTGQIIVQIGSNVVLTPTGGVEMDVEAFIKEGRTYVPIRFIAEALEFEVDWVPAKNVEGYKEYNYDFYVSIVGELGNYEAETPAYTGDGSDITNVVSNNPNDWPETSNKYQKDLMLAKNKEYINYMEANHKDKFHVAGYSITGYEDLGSTISYSPYPGRRLSSPAFYANDLRKTETGYIKMNISWFSVSKDAIEKTLYALIGREDGAYIFDYFDRGANPNLSDSETADIKANVWVKTPSGREFQVQTGQPKGVNLLIK